MSAKSTLSVPLLLFLIVVTSVRAVAGDHQTPDELNPVGEMHIPIGVPNSLDSVKTFVESEGGFSPGVGSFGVSFWVYDSQRQQLYSPSMLNVSHRYGLADGRALIPWSEWSASGVTVRTEVCEVSDEANQPISYLVGARATLMNPTTQTACVSLYIAVRPIGPAGGKITELMVCDAGDALLANGHTAVVANWPSTAAGVSEEDSIGHFAIRGELPSARHVSSHTGQCSGALKFELTLAPGQSRCIGIVCPVHAGQRAVRHQWKARKKNYVDEAVPRSSAAGIDLPDRGVAYYRHLNIDQLFARAESDWESFYAPSRIRVPSLRWNRGFDVMLAHAGLCMNEGAADVAVTNYTVFNRDGMYIANMMQKAGKPQLSEAIIDFFLKSPFNGRPFPESDNPGQILWSIGQHWQFTGDQEWLARVYPAAEKLARLIEYYRTSEGPHWVGLRSLEFGDALPDSERMLLEPGRCDGRHPEYTDAFDVAGIRVMAQLAAERDDLGNAARWRQLAQQLFQDYDKRFGERLPNAYGSYCVLWPCRLYGAACGSAHEQFKDIGRQELSTWRYFAPATAHQGLLTGSRLAGYQTVDLHLEHPQDARVVCL